MEEETQVWPAYCSQAPKPELFLLGVRRISLDFQGRKELDMGLRPLSLLKVISIEAASAGPDAEAGSR